MNLDQEIETALSLLNEITKTQTYLLSGACPKDVEPVLVANQSFSLDNLKEHLQQSLDIFNSPKNEDIKSEEHTIKHLDKSISSVNKSIKKFSLLLKGNRLPELDFILQTELESLYVVRDELMDVQSTIF